MDKVVYRLESNDKLEAVHRHQGPSAQFILCKASFHDVGYQLWPLLEYLQHSILFWLDCGYINYPRNLINILKLYQIK